MSAIVCECGWSGEGAHITGCPIAQEVDCLDATQCDRCATWVCEEHADDDYGACDLGIFCRRCHSELCQDRNCWDEG